MPVLDPAALSDRSSNDEVLDAFLAYLVEAGIEPYDHQEEAILELFAGNNVILNTPTGSGWPWHCSFGRYVRAAGPTTQCR